MKRIIVGLGLILASVTTSAARNLPKSEAPPDLRSCPEIGEGFVRLAGSDTCIKLAGSVRVEVLKQSGGSSLAGDH